MTGGLTWAVRAIAAVIAAIIVLSLGMASGLVRLRASAGHWPATESVLAFAMDRSIATNAARVRVPDLRAYDDALSLAAAHYATWCEACHGGPSSPHPLFVRQMVPPPPPLSDVDDPRQMFWVIKHGLKFTGMPGWPTQDRDDEVWVMAALVRRFDRMGDDAYRALVPRPPPGADAPEVVVRVCASCHGLDGEARAGGRVPRIAGQHEVYLEASLDAYARLARASGFMAPVADSVPAGERAAAARYYAGLPGLGAVPLGEGVDPALVARGRDAAARGVHADRVPACAHCHGPRTLAAVPENPRYPRLAGQHPAYLRTQLELFRRGVRGGTPYHVLMDEVAGHQLDDETIAAVAAFYGSL